jgi:hypothetical protein
VFSMVRDECSIFCKFCPCTENILYFTVKSDTQVYISFVQELRSITQDPAVQKSVTAHCSHVSVWQKVPRTSSTPLPTLNATSQFLMAQFMLLYSTSEVPKLCPPLPSSAVSPRGGTSCLYEGHIYFERNMGARLVGTLLGWNILLIT